jgi:integrase
MSDLIAGYVRHMKAAALSRNTIRDREELLHRVDRDLPMGLERATVEELADWMAGPTDRRQWTAKTKQTYYEGITGFFRYACDPKDPKLDYNPSESLSRPKTRRRAPNPIDTRELKLILGRLTGWWQYSALMASHAGARAFEIAESRREWFTEDNITFVGKGDLVATVPTHPLIWQAVRDFPRGPIAEHLYGRKVTPNLISVRFPIIVRRETGLVGINVHRLRHYFATMLLTARDLGGAGADLRTVQELMRHASPAQTAIYTQITDRQRKIAVSALPVLTPAPW